MTRSAVLFLIFNRPRTTVRVFEAIRAARPPRLYIAADGPRSDRPGEASMCDEARRIATSVDWPCEVRTLFRDRNCGCKIGVSDGITWFFDNEEQGIILEDDCLPHPDFFPFCDELLDRYAADERVWVLTGNNFQKGMIRGDGSYYFSRYNHVWGWASWRRAWKHYDVALQFWPQWKASPDWQNTITDPVERSSWSKIFDQMFRQEIDTWDYQWFASVWRRGGLTATPNVNLVSNIGFGPDATFCKNSGDYYGGSLQALGPIVHPLSVVRDAEADRYTFDHHFNGRNLRWPRYGYWIIRRTAGNVLRSAGLRK